MRELRPLVDVCRPDYCLSRSAETYLDEDNEPSELLEKLGEFALYWQKILTASKHGFAIGESRAFMVVQNEHSYIGMNKQQCAKTYRNAMVPMRNEAIDEVAAVAEADPMFDGMKPDDIAFSGTQEQLEHFGDLIGGVISEAQGTDLTLLDIEDAWNTEVNMRIGEYTVKVAAVNPFAGVFVMDQAVRLLLSEMIREEPETIKRIFSPDTLRTIPEDLQLVAAYDIARGQKSLLLRFFAQDGSEQNANTLLDYMNRNNHSPEAARSLSEAAFVAEAATGIVCPQNQYGLCEGLLARIDTARFSSLSTDMAKKFAQRRQEDRRSMLTFSDALVSKWFDPTVRMAAYQGRAGQLQSSKRTRRSGSPAKQIVDAPSVSIDRYDIQQIGFGRIYVTGIDEPLTLDYREEGADEASINQIIASKGFREYITKYSHDKKLEGFLRSALMAILRSDYTSEHAIKRMLNLHPIMLDDNQKLPMYRLAGNAQFTGKVAASDIAKRTRIFFGQRTINDMRVISLLPPRHKTEIEKSSVKGSTI